MLTIHKVRKELGDDIANALFEHFPGQQLNIPKKQSSMLFECQDDRDTFIFNLHTECGKHYDEIADIVGLSEDRVQKIVANKIKSKNY